jgi:hypothetical protein
MRARHRTSAADTDTQSPDNLRCGLVGGIRNPDTLDHIPSEIPEVDEREPVGEKAIPDFSVEDWVRASGIAIKRPGLGRA